MSSPNPIRVVVESYLLDLIPDFLLSCREDMQRAQAALARNDMSELEQIGHVYHGAGGSYGLDAITTLGMTLETSAASGDAETAGRTLNELSAYLDKVEIVGD